MSVTCRRVIMYVNTLDSGDNEMASGRRNVDTVDFSDISSFISSMFQNKYTETHSQYFYAQWYPIIAVVTMRGSCSTIPNEMSTGVSKCVYQDTLPTLKCTMTDTI